MSRNYLWGWQVAERGFAALTSEHMTAGETDKKQFVDLFLDPCVREAKCGWPRVDYVVCEIAGEDRTEFVLMSGGRNDPPRAARWINVTGDSKGAIAEAVWGLVFA